jgi:hypothetical protein
MAEPGAEAAVCEGRRPYERRVHAQKVAAVEAVCRRIEAGVTLAEACRCPTAPPWSTMQWWLGRYPELRAMVDAAQAVAAEAFGPRRAYHRWSPKIAAEVLSRLEAGRGLDEVCAEPDMPAYSTVMRWINERPDYFDAYMAARDVQADRLFDLAWRIARDATEDTTKTARLKIQTLKWRCAKLAPRRYGTIRAQDPEGAADEAGGAAAQTVTRFEVRHFAVTPDNKVVETTRAVRGLSPAEGSEFRQAIREGRITMDQLEALNAGGEPVNGPNAAVRR